MCENLADEVVKEIPASDVYTQHDIERRLEMLKAVGIVPSTLTT